MNPKVRAAALDFIKSQEIMTFDFSHEAYSAECRLFDEHFKVMSKDELNEYNKFVTWLDNSRMWESDLTVDKLYEVFGTHN